MSENDPELDNVYRAPLKDFVAERNALATSLKQSGDAESANRVQALKKPSASAWAVNQLYWNERATFDALIEAGDRLRQALESSPNEDAEAARLDAIETAVKTTRSLVEASGQNASEVLMRRVATTLDTLASYGSANPNPMVGRLTDDLEPPGFGAFAALAPALPEPEVTTPEDEVAKHVAVVEKARAALQEAENRVKRLEDELGRLQADLVAAQRASEDAAVKHAEAETQLEETRRKNT